MGITKTDSQILFYARQVGVDYSRTCMLGRLELYTSKEDIQKLIDKYKNAAHRIEEVEFKDEYSEPLFEILGSTKVDSIDYSDYEKATIIHDMNDPLPEQYKNSFTCVIDGGTIEHIFNFPVAIKNCMEAIQTGGHFIGISPVNNQMGHGFYQFSPELYYRIFSEENGFKMLKMFIGFDSENETEWYEVADPKKVSNRVMLVNNVPLSVRFIAQKIGVKEIFKTTPQQSDYVNTWNAFKSVSQNKAELSDSKLKYYYRKLLPYRLKVVLRNIYNIYKKDKVDSPTLGVIDPDHFIKTDI